MKINAFLRDRLGAPKHNPNWSWGAYNASEGILFLVVGEWAVNKYSDNHTWVTVYVPRWDVDPSLGAQERLRHVKAMESGVTAYAVVVEFSESSGKIKSFDDQVLLKLGKPVKERNEYHAKVTRRVSVEDLIATFSTTNESGEEICELLDTTADKTEARRLVDARIGQGAFRKSVLNLWKGKCPISGATTEAAIRASHIKPWKSSSNSERLDRFNGIPLLATFDALFDKGLFSFEDTGKIIISTMLSPRERRKLGLSEKIQILIPHAKCQSYLEHHRQSVLRH